MTRIEEVCMTDESLHMFFEIVSCDDFRDYVDELKKAYADKGAIESAANRLLELI